MEPITTCHGCHQPLEPLAATRVYHGGCDPQGRVEMLERALGTLLDALGRVPDVGTLAGVEVKSARAALAYRPAQMKRREG